VTVQDLVDRARQARTGPPSKLSPFLLGSALREVLGYMLACGASGQGPGTLDVGARVLAAVVADLEDADPTGE